MSSSGYSPYHWCLVSECKNTSVKTPEKLWIQVPTDLKMRNTWLKLARRDPKSLSTKTKYYFCEDHFDLENDMENYTQLKIMGSVKRIRMRPNCIPSRFDCQPGRKRTFTESEPRAAFMKRQRLSIIKEIEETTINETCDTPLTSSSGQDILTIEHKCGNDKAIQVIPPQEHKAIQMVKQNKTVGRSRKAASATSASSASTSVQPETKLVSRCLGRQSNTAVIYLKESENILGKKYDKDNTETIHSDYKTKDQAEIKTEPPDLDLRRCSECNDTITGFVWACVQCGSRACGACDARGPHNAHYVLRAPAHATEDDLESVLCKVREALSSIPLVSRAEWSPRVPDVEQHVAGDQSTFELIKMEIKVEKDELQSPPIVENPSTSSTADQIPRDPLDGAENACLSNLEDDKESVASSQSSDTLTASDPSDLSSADSEEEESLAPSEEKQLIWTPDMNKYLVRLHMNISKVEKKRSRVYSRIKQAFAIAYKVKVTKSQLEAQRKIILNKLLLSEDDVDAIVNERPFFCDMTVDNEVVDKEMDVDVSKEALGDVKVVLGDHKVMLSDNKVTSDDSVISDDGKVISSDTESDTEHMHQFLWDHQYFSTNKRNKNKRKRVEKDAKGAWGSGGPAPVP